MIVDYEVTAASEHDSQVIGCLTSQQTDGGEELWADSAYRSEEIEDMLASKSIISKIHEKGNRNHSLTKSQQKRNKKRSKVRARVEHIFGTIKMQMGGLKIRSIGLERAAGQIGLFNLCYNVLRSVHLLRVQGRGMLC